jgi:hypothetical protein
MGVKIKIAERAINELKSGLNSGTSSQRGDLDGNNGRCGVQLSQESG